MPLYEYVCENCSNKKELIRKFSEADHIVACDKCFPEIDATLPMPQINIMKRQISQKGSFQLKGNGWAKDGYSKR